jgi:hypothetical protein
MCFVRGLMAGDFASVMAPELSSKSLHLTVGGVSKRNICFISWTSSMIGIAFRAAWLRQTYSDSQLLRAISVCNRHTIGIPK